MGAVGLHRRLQGHRLKLVPVLAFVVVGERWTCVRLGVVPVHRVRVAVVLVQLTEWLKLQLRNVRRLRIQLWIIVWLVAFFIVVVLVVVERTVDFVGQLVANIRRRVKRLRFIFGLVVRLRFQQRSPGVGEQHVRDKRVRTILVIVVIVVERLTVGERQLAVLQGELVGRLLVAVVAIVIVVHRQQRRLVRVILVVALVIVVIRLVTVRRVVRIGIQFLVTRRQRLDVEFSMNTKINYE